MPDVTLVNKNTGGEYLLSVPHGWDIDEYIAEGFWASAGWSRKADEEVDTTPPVAYPMPSAPAAVDPTPVPAEPGTSEGN